MVYETKFKYTASGTPQQNSYAEMGFIALAGMSRAMMNLGNVPRNVRYKLFSKVAKTAMKLDSLVKVEIDGAKNTCVNYYSNIVSRWVKYMRTFGEVGTVRTGKDGKVDDRGAIMMMVEYADNHECNCYRMFNPLRNSIVESRDVTWLRRMYYPRLDADLTGQDPLVVIEADFSREERVQPQETRVKIEELKDQDDASVSSEVSKALSSLEQVVRRSVRTVTQTMTYNPTTGKAIDISAVQITMLVLQNWIMRN